MNATRAADIPRETRGPTAVKEAVVLEEHIVEIVSDSGEGAQRCGQSLGSIGARMGNGVWTVEIIPAEIQPPARSVAGASGNRIRLGSRPVNNGGDEADLVVAFNEQVLLGRVRDGELKPGCYILLESMWREHRDEAIRAMYAETVDRLNAEGYRVIEIPMERECLKIVKDARKGKNMFALGMLCSIYSLDPELGREQVAFALKKKSRAAPWLRAYKWPIWCFLAVAFWNLVGAGIFGFLINPPIALYYMQGLNTTPVHGHTALFGVYGMLGIGLMLFVLKGMAARRVWKEGVIRFALWSINIGLALMVLLSVLPVGLAQTVASVGHGLWYARSAEFMQQGWLDTARWLRIIGDTLFAVGAVALAWFVLGLKTGWSVRQETDLPLPVSAAEDAASA